MFIYFQLLNDSLQFALSSLLSNKLRTLLSLSGVTIGIFSIIAVLTSVDSMDRKIKSDLSGLDRNMIYLFNYSFGDTDVPQWKMDQFPKITYSEYEYLRRSISSIDKMSFSIFAHPENIQYGSKIVSNIDIQPCTNEMEDLLSLNIEQGRFFNESESNSGSAVIILGSEVASNLFGFEYPIGKFVRLYGKRFRVIGVLKKEGIVSFGLTKDTKAYISSTYYRQIRGNNSSIFTPVIILKPKKDVDVDEFKSELTQKLRTYRGIKPSEGDNFFINFVSGFIEVIDGIVSKMNLVGWIISAFSLLVGGFGIANIMFVSVKERTNLIGIQKSLGAKRKFILFQFLFEAIILSLLGGIIGMLLVWIITLITTYILGFEVVLGFWNIIIGISLAIAIGLLSGILPAISASKLDPVEAIRTGM